MEEEIIKEILRGLNWRERIVIKIFKKLFIKEYNITRIYTFNMLQK